MMRKPEDLHRASFSTRIWIREPDVFHPIFVFKLPEILRLFILPQMNKRRMA